MRCTSEKKAKPTRDFHTIRSMLLTTPRQLTHRRVHERKLIIAGNTIKNPPQRPSIKVRKSQLIAASLERLIKIKMRNLTFSRECTVICTRRRCHSSVQAKCKAVTRSIILTTLCRVCQDTSNVSAFCEIAPMKMLMTFRSLLVTSLAR